MKWKFVTLEQTQTLNANSSSAAWVWMEEQVLFIECQLVVTRYVCRCWYASPGIRTQFGPMMFDTANRTALTLNWWWWSCRLLFCQGSINWLSHLVNRLLIAMFAICNRFHYLDAIRMQDRTEPNRTLNGASCGAMVGWLVVCLLARDKQARKRRINAKRDLIN